MLSHMFYRLPVEYIQVSYLLVYDIVTSGNVVTCILSDKKIS